ncbi:MAG: hypothetical protein CBC56_002425 [Flavobacteriales bacterium TMED96]|nr:MAG: hypothetical protein CBC56_002425 [Flavobacteriales bacterium TMED96]|tara:strand:+ start:11334 stop:12191 length:858 start_codon:yes stop_codon:yes gene_type:complete
MSKVSVQIYCDGGKEVGYGHLFRSRALNNIFLSNGITSSLYGLTNEVNELIGKEKFDNQNADVIVLDSHRNIESRLVNLKKQNKKIITLDWFGNEKPHINIVIHPHQKPKALTKSFIGYKYVILRDQILNQKKINRKKNQVIICIGGGDLLGQSNLAADYLAKKGLNVIIVYGPSSNRFLKSEKHKVLYNPSNFTSLIASSSLVVTNGGGCMFESIYLKTPTLVLPQTLFEKRVARIAKKNNAILGLGLSYLKNFKTELKMNNFNFKFIDGRGGMRIVEIVKKIL